MLTKIYQLENIQEKDLEIKLTAGQFSERELKNGF